MAWDDAFLRGIREQPDDDGIRLVYADALEERGDPRSEFIRVQVALAACIACRSAVTGRRTAGLLESGYLWEPCRACRPLLHRERELLAEDGPELARLGDRYFSTPEGQGFWLGEWCFHVVFRRGFVEQVTCPLSAWLSHAAAIRAAQPVRDVTLTASPGLSSRLIARGLGLRRLHLGWHENAHFMAELGAAYSGTEVTCEPTPPALRIGDATFTVDDGWRVGPGGVRDGDRFRIEPAPPPPAGMLSGRGNTISINPNWLAQDDAGPYPEFLDLPEVGGEFTGQWDAAVVTVDVPDLTDRIGRPDLTYHNLADGHFYRYENGQWLQVGEGRLPEAFLDNHGNVRPYPPI